MISELLKRLGFTTSLSMLHIHRPAKLKHKGTFGNVCRRAVMYSLGLFAVFGDHNKSIRCVALQPLVLSR